MSKVWLITGASKGLGRSILEAALACGGKVVAAASDTRPLADLKARYGDQILLCLLDVTDEFGARRAVKVALAAYGRLDILVNSTGYGQQAPFHAMGAADVRVQIGVNLAGVVNLTRAALPAMRDQRSGTVVNLSSIDGSIAASDFGAYEAARGAMRGFTEVLARQAEPLGVRTIALEQTGGRRGNGGRAAREIRSVANLLSNLPEGENLPNHLTLGADSTPVPETPDWAKARPPAGFGESRFQVLHP